MLLRTPCSSELRCDPDIEDKKPTPLCSDAQTEKALQRTLRLDDDLDEDQNRSRPRVTGSIVGCRRQGAGPRSSPIPRGGAPPLRQTFTNAEDRRSCKQLMIEPADWACRQPGEIATAFTEAAPGTRRREEDDDAQLAGRPSRSRMSRSR